MQGAPRAPTNDRSVMLLCCGSPQEPAPVYVDFTSEQKSLRVELRAYFDQLMTPEIRDGLIGLEGGPMFR